ncbi:LCP family glycopolymer transferase [Kribbella jiaozuonensis]|uniref:LytR family transcriptional regulator n=1 Tax=Kribbella jiaozuonensis TaxID=2575441 RepID=A0A4U3LPA7_9ACTN|nr:LCP family protein [Kribbella jiaozuonensis]TKK77482.1 LytR family transcriptional regulator [Kribbella jiaozuonensis]
MSRSTRAAGRRAAPRASRSRHRSHRARTTSKAIGLTLLSALVPGSGLLMGGRKKLGAFVLTISVGLLLIAAYVGLTQRDSVLALAVSPRQLLIATGAVVLLGVLWIWVVVASHKLLRPVSMTYTGRLAGSMFVGLLCFGIAVPTTVAAQTVMAQRDLVGSVFQSEGNSKSATRPKVTNASDPWAKTPRLNLLLLGADDGVGRTGVRTDTVIVASIDTKTGNTALISLSRNWMRMPFPEDSPLHKVYPDGFWDPNKGNVEQPEYYLDAMYDNIPKAHPGILGQTDNEGADVVKLAASAALGLDIDYYMQVNLAGFRQIIDAVGGITVNVNYRVPIGGDYGEGPGSNTEKKPSGYIEPGPNQKLDGYHALWFARGRYGLSDPSRQERQRCTIHALVNSVNPATLVTKYQQIASAGKQLLRTDIPQEILPAFIQLGLKVKNAKVSNIDLDKNKNFPTGKNPDYTAMQEIIQKALAAQTNPVASTPTVKPTKKPTSGTTTKKPTAPKTTVTPGAAENLNDACAYNPSQTGNGN